jgi:hypothetical protein
MEKKYIIPASTLIAGILIWVIFLIVYTKNEITLISELSLGIITGGLLIFSAFRCRRVGGPKAGNIFRASLLFIMAVLTYWLIGMTAAILLLAASIVILLLVLKKYGEPPKIAEA